MLLSESFILLILCRENRQTQNDCFYLLCLDLSVAEFFCELVITFSTVFFYDKIVCCMWFESKLTTDNSENERKLKGGRMLSLFWYESDIVSCTRGR